MPIPVPPGALPVAHRVLCLRGVRALSRGRLSVNEYGFDSDSSKKCSYCTSINEKCVPIPIYVGEEFEELATALDLLTTFWDVAGPAPVPLTEEEKEEEEGMSPEEREGREAERRVREERWEGEGEAVASRVTSAALRLATVVQVATAQVVGCSSVEVLLANHHLIQSLQGEVWALREQVAGLSAAVAALAERPVVVQAPAPATPRRSARGKGKGVEKEVVDDDEVMQDPGFSPV